MRNDFNQWSFDGNRLELKVLPAPLFVRGTLFFFAFLPAFGGLVLLFTSFSQGWFKPSLLLGLAVLTLMSVFFLRAALWNSIGKEIIIISENQVTYQPDFGWMQGKITEKAIDPLSFAFEVGEYAEDDFGKLHIGRGTNEIVSVIKVKMPQLEKLLKELEKNYLVDWESKNEELQ